MFLTIPILHAAAVTLALHFVKNVRNQGHTSVTLVSQVMVSIIGLKIVILALETVSIVMLVVGNLFVTSIPAQMGLDLTQMVNVGFVLTNVRNALQILISVMSGNPVLRAIIW